MSSAPQVADDAKSHGYTHVQTHGGLIPLDHWTPYGQRDGHEPVTFYLYIGAGPGGPIDQIRETATHMMPGLVLGVWQLFPGRLHA